jgi:hypothetical protein
MISFNVARFDSQCVVMEVPDHVLEDQGLIDAVVAGGICQFELPVVLVGAEQRTTYGSPELVDFLSYVNLARLPWVPTPVAI